MITINSVRRQHQGSISISGLCKPSRLKARWLMQEAMIAARSGGLLLVAPPRWARELLQELPAGQERILQVFAHPRFSQQQLLEKALQQSPCQNIWIWGDDFNQQDSRLVCFNIQQSLLQHAANQIVLKESVSGLRLQHASSGKQSVLVREARRNSSANNRYASHRFAAYRPASNHAIYRPVMVSL